MAKEINKSYYDHLAVRLQGCQPGELPSLLAEHKKDLAEGGFENPTEAFTKNLRWIAGRIITDRNGKKYKEPDAITDQDLAKLEILRTQEKYEYQKELQINYTQTCSYGRARAERKISFPYSVPFFVYLAHKKADFTDYQTSLYLDTIKRASTFDLQCSYAISSAEHLSRKNILHTLLEGELQPNKKKITDAVFPVLAQKAFGEFVKKEHWEGPTTGKDCSNAFYVSRTPLHSAVRSGRLENVQYAVEKGEVLKANYGGCDRSAFAEATHRFPNPAYREIAHYLLGVALGQENGVKILSESYATSRDTSYPIHDFARIGDLDMVVALAQANVGIPVFKGEFFIDTYEHITKCGMRLTERRKEYVSSDTGERKMIPSIKHAVFNLDPQRGYAEYQNIFGYAIEFLVEQNVLDSNEIPEESLTNSRFMNFVYALRSVAEEEKERDPSFLRDKAAFTDSFAQGVKAAKEATNNFEKAYKAKKNLQTPSGAKPPRLAIP